MTLVIIIALIDLAIMHVTYSYQRTTQLIARQHVSSKSEIATMQMKITPDWVPALIVLNWIPVVAVVVLLWNIEWWYPVAYVVLFRVVLMSVLPVHRRAWEDYIRKRYVRNNE